MTWVSTGSGNGLSPVRHQAIPWTNAGLLSIGLLEGNFSEIRIVILLFSFKKLHLQLSSAIMAAILSREDELNQHVRACLLPPRERDIEIVYIAFDLKSVPRSLIIYNTSISWSICFLYYVNMWVFSPHALLGCGYFSMLAKGATWSQTWQDPIVNHISTGPAAKGFNGDVSRAGSRPAVSQWATSSWI